MILKKSIIVFIPYNFRGKQTNVFLSTLLSFFLNLYFTNHRLHSVILLLSCRKLKSLLSWKPNSSFPTLLLRFFSNASSSLLTKGRVPLVSLLLPVYPQEAGKKLWPEPPTGTDQKLQAESTVFPSQRVRKRVAS